MTSLRCCSSFLYGANGVTSLKFCSSTYGATGAISLESRFSLHGANGVTLPFSLSSSGPPNPFF